MAGPFPGAPSNLDLHTTDGGTTYQFKTDHGRWVLYKTPIGLDDLLNVNSAGKIEGDALVWDVSEDEWVPGLTGLKSDEDIVIAKANPTATLDASSGLATFIADAAAGQDAAYFFKENGTLKASITYDAGANLFIFKTNASEPMIFKIANVEKMDLSGNGLQLGNTGARVTHINATIFQDNDTTLMTSQAIKEKIAADALTNPLSIDLDIDKANPTMTLDASSGLATFVADCAAGQDAIYQFKEVGAVKGSITYDAGVNQLIISTPGAEPVIVDGVNVAARDHAKYLNAEAVSAIAAADPYIKNNASDSTTGDITIAKSNPSFIADASSGSAAVVLDGASGQDGIVQFKEIGNVKASITYDGGANQLIIATSGAEPVIIDGVNIAALAALGSYVAVPEEADATYYASTTINGGSVVLDFRAGTSVETNVTQIGEDWANTIPAGCKAIDILVYCAQTSAHTSNRVHIRKNGSASGNQGVRVPAGDNASYWNWNNGVVPVDANGKVQLVFNRGAGTVYCQITLNGYYI